MARSDALTDLATARASVVDAIADVDGGDSTHGILEDILERMDYVKVRLQTRTA